MKTRLGIFGDMITKNHDNEDTKFYSWPIFSQTITILILIMSGKIHTGMN